MRFRAPRKPTPYLSRREQWRMLRLIGLLALVLIAVNFAARPESWHWLLGRDQPAPPSDGAPAINDVDFSVRVPDDAPLPEGVFRVEMAAEPAADERQPAADGACDVTLPRDLLAAIEDRTLGIPKDEAGAFFAVLDKASDLPPGCLAKAGQDVPFTVLMTHTDEYRGVPISIQGTLRKFTEIPAPRNDQGIESYYEAWLTTRDSANRLYKVIAATNPDRLPIGEWDAEENGYARTSAPAQADDAADGGWIDPDEPEIQVRTTGYFFKSEGYATRGGAGLTVAPLLIAPALDRAATPPAAPARTVPVIGYVIGIGAAIAAALGLLLWLFHRSDRRFEQATLKRYTDVPREQFDALRGVETTDPADLFRQMEQPPPAGGSEPPDENLVP